MGLEDIDRLQFDRPSTGPAVPNQGGLPTPSTAGVRPPASTPGVATSPVGKPPDSTSLNLIRPVEPTPQIPSRKQKNPGFAESAFGGGLGDGLAGPPTTSPSPTH